MLRQTLLAVAASVGASAFGMGAQAKPVTLDCDLERKIIVSGRVRSTENVKEKVVFDGTAKTLKVGKRSGDYVVGGYGVATLAGLPKGEKVTFDFYKNLLSTTQIDEFGMLTAQKGNCNVISR